MEQRFDRFTLLIAALYQDIRKLEGLEMEEFGLRSGHGVCLHQLLAHPDGLTLKQLTVLCDLDKAAVSRHLAGLQEAGLAAQEEETDRRYNRRWRLTEKGEAVAAETGRRIDRAVGYVGAFLTERERRTLYRQLGQIAGNLGKYIQGRKQEAGNERTDHHGLGE